ncbi:MAG: ABC transporter permease [Clostridia bacterium]
MSDIVNGIPAASMSNDSGELYRTGGKMLAVSGVIAVVTILATLFAARTAAGFAKDLRQALFEKVENYSLHEFDTTIGTASLITRTTNDVMQPQQLVVMGMRMMMMALIMCIWGIIKAIESAPQLTRILAVIIAALLVVVWIVASKTIPVFQILQKKLDRLNLVVREKLTGIRVIRAFNKQSYEKKRFDESNQDLTDTAVRVNRTVAILMPAVMIGMNLATVAIMWFGSKGSDTMGLELGTLMAFVQYAMQVMFAIIACAMIFVMPPSAGVCQASQ